MARAKVTHALQRSRKSLEFWVRAGGGGETASTFFEMQRAAQYASLPPVSSPTCVAAAGAATPGRQCAHTAAMPKPNYRFDKRQRELAKQKQREEKRLKKEARKAAESAAEPAADAASLPPGTSQQA